MELASILRNHLGAWALSIRLSMEKNTKLRMPCRISCPKQTLIGKNCYIGKESWFSIEGRGTIEIGDNCAIGRYFICASTGSVKIGNRVMVSERVFITDCDHDYMKVGASPLDLPSTTGGKTEIGDETWLGVGCCILKNVNIGKHCVIGANSVVTSDVPDFCVAAGNPAKIIRQYDPARKEWAKKKKDSC